MLKLARSLALFVVLSLLSVGCDRQRIRVVHMPTPDYPVQARLQQMEGVVVVTVGVGADGKVSYALGKGMNSLLVQAAEENAKAWIFEVPAHAQYPLEHQVTYTFRLDKAAAANLLPTVVTDLPNSVEIIGTRAKGDEVHLVQPKNR